VEIFSTLTVVFFVAGIVLFADAIRKGATVKKASWLVWLALDSAALVNMAFDHTLNAQIISAVGGAIVIVITALKYGASGWSKLDKACLLIGATAVPWVIIKPTAGTAISCVGMLIASWPTFKGAYLAPEKEGGLAWSVFWFSCLSGLLAVPKWTLASSIQPVTFMLVETIMLFLIYIRPRFRRRLATQN